MVNIAFAVIGLSAGVAGYMIGKAIPVQKPFLFALGFWVLGAVLYGAIALAVGYVPIKSGLVAPF